MLDALTIKHAQGMGGLEFLRATPEDPSQPVDAFVAVLNRPSLTASVTVTICCTEAHDFAAFFDDLARNWNGWAGAKLCDTTIALRFSATHDKLGHITLTAELRHDDWLAHGDLIIEAGQLGSIAKEVREFLRL